MKHFIIESGVQRIAKEAKCLFCNESFLCRKNCQRKYCSKKCSNFGHRNRVKIPCASCGKEIQRNPSDLKSKHNVYFCSRQCKEKEQRLSGTIIKIRPYHYGNGQRSYRSRVDFAMGCRCGEKKTYLLTVHHIDGNRKNNTKENLEVVCGHCHMKRHLRFFNGSWIYDPKAITPRNMIDSL